MQLSMFPEVIEVLLPGNRESSPESVLTTVDYFFFSPTIFQKYLPFLN